MPCAGRRAFSAPPTAMSPAHHSMSVRSHGSALPSVSGLVSPAPTASHCAPTGPSSFLPPLVPALQTKPGRKPPA
eukprot:13467236-Ditylum_brightwellii.AAC.1